MFSKDLVRAGAFPREFTTILMRLFEDRQTGDYDPTSQLDLAEAKRDVDAARRIVETVEAYLKGGSGGATDPPPSAAT